MSNYWKTLRAELPDDVRLRLDEKRMARLSGKVLVHNAADTTQ
jgi:hypothetical protein